MRPALMAKSGSRGKIQVRCCQGRMASSLSQRHTVLSLIVATMPQRCASRTMSAVLRRERGKPSVAGSSQAMAFICTMSSGGKNRGSPRARSLLQTAHAFMEEPLAPQAHHVAADGESRSDLIIGQSLGGEENHPGAQDFKIWQRILARPTFQDLSFLPRELDLEWAFPRHPTRPSPAGKTSREAPSGQYLYVS